MVTRTRHRWIAAVVAILCLGLLADAGAASAAMSSKQKAHVRAQLRKQIKKNPRVIKRKSFVKKAALVNFKLPVTLRLRGGNTPPAPGGCTGFNTAACQPDPGVIPGATNPNLATVDLGASLGKRTVALGGKLAAEIVFRDSFDGGALGNVDLVILPSATKTLSTTSIPLLWNDQITQPGSRFDAPDLYLDDTGLAPSGCANLTGANLTYGANIFGSGSYLGIAQPAGYPGWPISDTPGGPVNGYLTLDAGIDDTQNPNVGVRTGTEPGDNDIVGPNPAPFPAGPQTPTFSNAVKNTVLRTNALDLNVATPGTVVDQTDTSPNGPNGSQNIVIGKSGGQANLFGNIPGKAYGIDVTVSLATQINSIFRVVDQDSFHTGLYDGQSWPADIYNCRQVWSGYLQNYIPDVRLKGDLKIAPGLTSDGHLRIAKATVNSTGIDDARFAVAACLFPHTTYDKRNPLITTITGPTAGGYAGGSMPSSLFAEDVHQAEPRPTAACMSAPDPIITNSALPPATVGSLTGASTLNGYTVSNNGSRVTVAADLSVQNVSIDVLIGDV